ncbi:hypothetical protein OSB04_un000897 [Centaurea solstitialis]|uniref:Ubiquitin-like protease family profile domain-containing protein n=1 Tax=Centaurea solstitialis TaxID=347529 RepID=A0AA38SPN2_9ASTR|nr:hypothetical protein OSB04_un000897 [Centaurea solstitialis]
MDCEHFEFSATLNNANCHSGIEPTNDYHEHTNILALLADGIGHPRIPYHTLEIEIDEQISKLSKSMKLGIRQISSIYFKMIRLAGGRKRSERLMKNNSFGNFTNTADNPICVDVHDNEIKEEDLSSKKSKRMRIKNQKTEVKPKKDFKKPTIINVEGDVKGVSVRMRHPTGSTSLDKLKLVVGPGMEASRARQDDQDDDFQRPLEEVVAGKSKNMNGYRDIPQRGAPNIVDKMKGISLNEIDKKASKEIRDGRNHIVKKKGVKEGSTRLPRRDVHLPVLRTRTSPRVLYDCIKSLNKDQRDVVEVMRLGSLLDMKMDGIPQKLGFWLVDKLDTVEMKLRACNGSIDITIDSIHSILDVPKEGFDLIRDEPPSRERDIASEFRKQFPEKRKMRPTDVMDLIVESDESGLQFKTNFLMLYVTSTVWPDVVVDKIQPPTHAWNLALLQQRQTSEINNGGLGSAQLAETGVVEDVISLGDEVNETSGCSYGMKLSCIKGEKCNEEDYGAGLERKNDIELMNEKIDCIVNARVEIETLLASFILKYHNDMDFVKYKYVLDDIFKYHTSMGRTSYTAVETSNQAGVENNDAVVKPVGIKNENDGSFVELGNVSETKTVSEDELQISPSPLSQFWFSSTLMAACDKAEKSSMGNKKVKLEEKEVHDVDFQRETVEPQPLLKATREEKGKQIVIESPVRKGRKGVNLGLGPTTTLAERGQRRTIRLGEHLRSPYVRRAVDMKVTAEERRMHEWAQTFVDGDSEIVFSLRNGIKVTRSDLASLALQQPVHPIVIDAWADLLNCEEEHRNQNSLRRHFFSTKVIGDNEITNSATNLKKNNRNDEKRRFFFPILDNGNYYLVVVNLKIGSMVVIDHRAWSDNEQDEIVQKYDAFVDTLHRLLIKHLEAVKHPAWVELDGNMHEILTMNWQTRVMAGDGGIFLMRHMETWMGDARSWKTGFAKEGPGLKNQLTDLRKKYCTKFLRSAANEKKMEMSNKFDEFHKTKRSC